MVYKKSKIAVAMSGGVDSSVAAALLKSQGYDAIGVFMHFWGENVAGKIRDNICCSLESQEDARRVCRQLGMPLYTINMEIPFKNKIVDDFIDEYKNCRTPNPCVRCNKYIKFGELWKKLKPMGVDFVATGHYAVIKMQNAQPKADQPPAEKRKRQNAKPESQSKSSGRHFQLLKSRDRDKDQTYFLHQITQKQLARVLFPVGDYTKDEVRALAKKFGLPTANKKESQEICFVADADTGKFLKRHIIFVAGEIKDIASGKVIGAHAGLPLYTVGQRKGIGLAGGPWYVVRLDKKDNELWVSKNEKDISRKDMIVKNVNWIGGKEPEFPLKIKCKIRYRSDDEDAAVTPILGKPKKYLVKFTRPQRAITPGQYAVFWRENECLGGGVIE